MFTENLRFFIYKLKYVGSPNTTERDELIIRGNMNKVNLKLRVECAEASNLFETITCQAGITLNCGTTFTLRINIITMF